MEEIVAAVLRSDYSDVLLPGAVLDVPFGWTIAAQRCLAAARDLGPQVRIHEIVRTAGLMCVAIGWAGEMSHCPDDVWSKMSEIAGDARTLSAWSCVVDGKPGWLVDTADGPQVLCPDCQEDRGIVVRKYEA